MPYPRPPNLDKKTPPNKKMFTTLFILAAVQKSCQLPKLPCMQKSAPERADSYAVSVSVPAPIPVRADSAGRRRLSRSQSS